MRLGDGFLSVPSTGGRVSEQACSGPGSAGILPARKLRGITMERPGVGTHTVAGDPNESCPEVV
ncbi:MAG: hypothetical protein HY791_10185 [Deltaproteobacteria bacterium]|nr:hypothetical protein [Deltaproteobacteria bacterium]